MPSLGIAISHHSYGFCSNNLQFRPVIHFHDRIFAGNCGGLRLASNFTITEKLVKKLNFGYVERWPGRLVIKAAATLEIASGTCISNVAKGSMLSADVDLGRSSLSMVELQSPRPSEDEAEEDGEKLRRMRISRANKGMTPWNKGRKHSAETIQRIRERTKLAMQDPKMKMKMRLTQLGNKQTEETKMKIRAGVRRGWARRRQKLMLQETCHYEWQNLIAEAALRGVWGEEELEWDSYKTLNEQLKEEYLQGVEKRKEQKTRVKGLKRAPKSAEQKRKISEAVAAKWADPEYRDRVFSGRAKHHGTPNRVRRKPQRKPDSDRHIQVTNPAKKDEIHNLEMHETSKQVQKVQLRKDKRPFTEDPLSVSKLNMLKNIQAQRAAAKKKKNEAVSRAKLLVAKAEAAVMALEAAAQSNIRVQAALVESRALVAKANQFLESIENKAPAEHINKDNPYLQNQNTIKVNGSQAHRQSRGDSKVDDYRFNEFLFPDLANRGVSDRHFRDQPKTEQALEPNNRANPGEKPLEFQSKNGEERKMQGKMLKKWIRGRLVEVVEA